MAKYIESFFEQQLENAEPLTEEMMEKMNEARKEYISENPDSQVPQIEEDRIGQKKLLYMVFRDETQEEFESFAESAKKDGLRSPEKAGSICEVKSIWDDDLDQLEDQLQNKELVFFDMAGGDDLMMPRFARTDMEFDLKVPKQ